MVPVINDLFKVVLLLTFQLKHTEVIDDYQIEPFDFFEELEFMPFKLRISVDSHPGISVITTH